MSTVTLAPGGSTVRTRPSTRPGAEPSRGPRGPRLLLPPLVEPETHEHTLAETVLAHPEMRSVLASVTERVWPVPAVDTARTTRRLPDPDQLCGSVVLAAVVVLTGVRPITQLTRWVAPRVLDALTAQLATTRQDQARRRPEGDPARTAQRVPAEHRSSTHRPDTSGATAGRSNSGGPGRRPRVAPTPRATVRRVMLSRLDDRTAEACVVLHDGTRVRAAAVRLQVHRGRWRVTVLEIG